MGLFCSSTQVEWLNLISDKWNSLQYSDVVCCLLEYCWWINFTATWYDEYLSHSLRCFNHFHWCSILLMPSVPYQKRSVSIEFCPKQRMHILTKPSTKRPRIEKIFPSNWRRAMKTPSEEWAWRPRALWSLQSFYFYPSLVLPSTFLHNLSTVRNVPSNLHSNSTRGWFQREKQSPVTWQNESPIPGNLVDT